MRPHRQQPTRLTLPWDSPGKNTGVGCHFPLQCMKVKSESEVAQSCLTLSDPMNYSLPGSSIHGFSRQEYWSGVPLPSPLLYIKKKKILKDDAMKVRHSICQQILKTQQWPQDWKTSVFIPIPKKGTAKEYSNYHTIDSSHTPAK